VVQLLLEQDDFSVNRALVFAARNRHKAIVQVLLELNSVSLEYNNALRYATEGKHKTVVQLLRKY
jgi:hypothetical protein